MGHDGFREHPISGSSTIIRSDRNKSQEQLRRQTDRRDWTLTNTKEGLIGGDDCPFCVGREGKTPGESRVYRSQGTLPNTPGWWVRVVPNLRPAVSSDILSPGEPLVEAAHGLYKILPAYGEHFLIVESPEHTACLATVGQYQIREILHMWREMYAFVGACRNIKYVSLFENFGPQAGASQPHPHSQIVGLPIFPEVILTELRGARKFYENNNNRCFYCEHMENGLKTSSLVVEETPNFCAWCPFTSKTPYQFLIGPKYHQGSFANISTYGRDGNIDPLSELAGLLQNMMKRLHVTLNDPDYQLYIHNGPTNEPEIDFYHWHIQVRPITTAILAGMEHGFGVFINPRAPEAAAEDLRKADISSF